MLNQFLRTGLISTCMSSTVLAAEIPRSLLNRQFELSCSHAAGVCKTGHNGARAATFSDTRFAFVYRTPPGWAMYGVAEAAYIGQASYDVTVLAQTSHHLTCGWRTEGSKQLFGPGGWVSGYCWSKARRERRRE